MAEQSLIVDDIFNDNFNLKRKKMQLDEYTDAKKPNVIDNPEAIKHSNTKELKRKSKSYDSDYDIDKIVQSNIIIDKESNKITLELRQTADEYKINRLTQDDGRLENIDPNEYPMKDNDIQIDTGGKILNNNDGEYVINDTDETDNGVSN